jgi:uncharacterized protein YoxC
LGNLAVAIIALALAGLEITVIYTGSLIRCPLCTA